MICLGSTLSLEIAEGPGKPRSLIIAAARLLRYFCGMKIALAATIMATSIGSSQTAHFPVLEWKEKESDHIMIRTHGTGTDPARKYSEKTYEVMEEILPGLTPDFGKNEFRAPGGGDAGANGQFRFTTYLVEAGADFQQLVTTEAGRNNWPAGNIQIVNQVGNFTDRQNRYLVICKGDPTTSSGGGEKDRTPILVHSTGSLLMKGRSRQAQLPFWMTAGMGYYAEHMVLDKCSVAYLDFTQYYQQDPNEQVEILKGGVLALGTDWARTLRDLCKKGQRESLEKTLAAEILTLSPNESGYLFALTYFLVSDEEMAKKYQTFLKAIRGGDSPSKELLLSTFGYATDAELETAWYEWMMSRKFK